jgi:hypothetical protein
MISTQKKWLILLLSICGVVVMSGCGQSQAPQATKGTLTIHQAKASWAVLYHDFKSLKQNADLVVAGTIVGVSKLTGDPPLVFTQFIFQITRTIWNPKHLAASNQVIVNQTGGIVGNDLYEIRDGPLFQQGEAMILFLRQYEPGLFSVIGGPSGRFELHNGMVTPINDEGVRFTAPMPEADFLTAVAQA